MKPSIGRIVHYVARGSADGMYPKVCRAAIVTEVNYDLNGVDGDAEGYVALVVLNPTGIFFHESCDYAETSTYPEGMTPGSWHWPERVD